MLYPNPASALDHARHLTHEASNPAPIEPCIPVMLSDLEHCNCHCKVYVLATTFMASHQNPDSGNLRPLL